MLRFQLLNVYLFTIINCLFIFEGYFLNPQFQYGVTSSNEMIREVMDGLKKVITRLEPDMDAQVKATNQVRTNYLTFNSNNLLLQMLLVMIVQIVVVAVSR